MVNFDTTERMGRSVMFELSGDWIAQLRRMAQTAQQPITSITVEGAGIVRQHLELENALRECVRLGRETPRRKCVN